MGKGQGGGQYKNDYESIENGTEVHPIVTVHYLHPADF